jgi:ribosomal protein S18 acetylase RimI-like enzyme
MLTIRRARIADAPTIHALQQLAFVEEGRRSGTREIPPLQEEVALIAQHIEQQIALVAVREETMVGCVRGIVADETCMIRGLIVHPSCQGQGIGSTLLKALEAVVPAPIRIDLTTNTVMEGNVPFYERHGYRVMDSTSPIPGITLAHMSKYLA